MATNVQEPSDSQHIFAVAARSLQDCVELLQTLKAAVAAEEEEEERCRQCASGNGTSHDQVSNGHTNSHWTMEGDRHPPAHSMCDINHTSRSIPDAQNGTSDKDKDKETASHTTTTTTTTTNLSLPQAITPCKRSEMYTKASVLACQGTIGKHVRHLHDHYRLLLSTFPPRKGLSPNDVWTVDYDQRSREVPMETDMDYAISELKQLQFMLEKTRDTQNDKHSESEDSSSSMPSNLLQPVVLHATIDPAHPTVSFLTTFGRELWFCSLHAVHHFAMIKVICGEFGMPLTEGFGLAPSTVKSRQTSQ
ncbi:hypothetical protein B0O80DRAFT_445764 [Mortierella sp. GBAus27b]|nr:hypothetical protein B0O80DRAFT_445764 [Mortierella sp. GBAus27b]